MVYIQMCKQRRLTTKHLLQNGNFVSVCVLVRESSIDSLVLNSASYISPPPPPPFLLEILIKTEK